MFSSLRTRILPRSLAVALAVLLPIAQALELGALSLAHVPAHPMSSVTFSRAPSGFAAFARAVGGVAFIGTAASTDGTSISRLRYDAAAPDGRRLLAEIRRSNGVKETVTVEAYDWILVPLARLVATDATGAVTLFGSLKDSDLQEELVREKNAMIANYHPALENTLLGLRLLQADMMPFEENATDLFKERGQYILGAGEVAPNDGDLKANRAAFRKVSQWAEQQPFRHTSYITGDVDNKVTFATQGGKLKLTGEPTWYCWRHDDEKTEAVIADMARSLSPDAFALLMLSRLDERSEIELRRLQRASPAQVQGSSPSSGIALMARAESEAYRALGKLIIAQMAASPSGGRGATLLDKASLTNALAQKDASRLESLFGEAQERAEALRDKSPDRFQSLDKEIEAIGPKIREAIEALPVVQMGQYSAGFSRRIADERGINPVVYDALRRSVQVAALFRSAKQVDADGFQQFVQSLRQVTPGVSQPRGYRVNTPTVYPRG